MKKFILSVAAIMSAAISVSAFVPRKANFPDIPGYVVMKGDFHTHSAFSDGRSWPTTRVYEAIYDDLDILAVTDHLEPRLKKFIDEGLFRAENITLSTSYELAKKAAQAENLPLMVLHGGELTRGSNLFAGHFNLHFIKDAEAISNAEQNAPKSKDKVKSEEDAILAGLREARKQGCFITLNHPDWDAQARNETKWWPFYDRLLKEGLLDGIEIVNSTVSPFLDKDAFEWAVEKNLTIVSGTDCHSPMNKIFDYASGEMRSMTLVFAKERTEESVKEALQKGRTAVFNDGRLYGKQEFLEPVLRSILDVKVVSKSSDHRMTVRLTNSGALPVILYKAPGSNNIRIMRFVKVNPGEILDLSVIGEYDEDGVKTVRPIKDLKLDFYVQNFLSAPGKPIRVSFTPAGL